MDKEVIVFKIFIIQNSGNAIFAILEDGIMGNIFLKYLSLDMWFMS